MYRFNWIVLQKTLSQKWIYLLTADIIAHSGCNGCNRYLKSYHNWFLACQNLTLSALSITTVFPEPGLAGMRGRHALMRLLVPCYIMKGAASQVLESETICSLVFVCSEDFHHIKVFCGSFKDHLGLVDLPGESYRSRMTWSGLEISFQFYTQSDSWRKTILPVLCWPIDDSLVPNILQEIIMIWACLCLEYSIFSPWDRLGCIWTSPFCQQYKAVQQVSNGRERETSS